MSEELNIKSKKKGGFIEGLPVPVAQPTNTGGCCGGATHSSEGDCCGGSSGGNGTCCGGTTSGEPASNTSNTANSSCCG